MDKSDIEEELEAALDYTNSEITSALQILGGWVKDKEISKEAKLKYLKKIRARLNREMNCLIDS